MTKDEALTLALEALERASHSLGSFVSDHGWGQEDMNTLDSVMAAEHRIKEALARPEQRLKQVAHVYLLDAKGWPKVGWDDGRGIKVGDKLYIITESK